MWWTLNSSIQTPVKWRSILEIFISIKNFQIIKKEYLNCESVLNWSLHQNKSNKLCFQSGISESGKKFPFSKNEIKELMNRKLFLFCSFEYCAHIFIVMSNVNNFDWTVGLNKWFRNSVWILDQNWSFSFSFDGKLNFMITYTTKGNVI
jgi:hypothetical protein